jgi:hypothetical protein
VVQDPVFDVAVGDGGPLGRGSSGRVGVEEADDVAGGQEPLGQGLHLDRGPCPRAGGGHLFDDDLCFPEAIDTRNTGGSPPQAAGGDSVARAAPWPTPTPPPSPSRPPCRQCC